MRAFVTGATGFIGGHVARKLRRRGDEVVALVRNPSKAAGLRHLGCSLVQGDLADVDSIEAGVRGCDSVFHIAAMYKVGIFEDECRAMHEANVEGTRNVLQAGVDAGVDRMVYVSTIGYFGNTRGEVVDESFERTDFDWLTCYDETKYEAHRIALDYIGKGAPIVIVQPGGVYGADDPSDLGMLIDRARRGWLKLSLMPEVGFNFVHVDDASDGILLAHDKGSLGESYILGGELTTMGALIERVVRLSGRKPPKREVPVAVLRAVAPFGKVIGRLLGIPPNLRELIRGSHGVTYWATDEKARRELGYSARPLDVGLKEVLTTS